MSITRTVVLGTVLVLALNGTGMAGARAQMSAVRQDLRAAFTIYEWQGESPAYVANPTCVAIYEGKIYVLDTGNKRVAVFDREGRFLRAFGREGQGPGELGLGSGRIMGPDLAVADGRVYVYDPPQRRVHVFATAGETIGSFVVEDGRMSASSIAATGGLVYLRMGGSQSASGGEILVFEPDKEGREVFATRLIDPGPSEASRFNQSQIAVGADGRVMQAYWWWPILRLHRPGSITDAPFVDDSWWEGRGMEDFVPDVRDWFEEARRTGSPSGFSRRGFFFDVEHIPASDGWVALSNGGYVEFFGDDRRLVRQFRLRPPTGDEFVGMTDIAIDDDGALLCGADPQTNSEVLCYEIPGFE